MGCDCHFFVEKKTSSNNYGGPKDLSEDRNIKIEEIIDKADQKLYKAKESGRNCVIF